MRSLRWVEWPKTIVVADSRYGANTRKTLWVAHAFVLSNGVADQSVCGERPGPLMRIVQAGRKHDKCYRCDEILRAIGGPHPPAVNETSSSIVYVPKHTFEDWENLT